MNGLVDLLHGTATALSVADMPEDPFKATELLDGCRHLAAELVSYTARIRAERLANAKAWADHDARLQELASLDPGHKPPPPPPEEEPPPPPPTPPPPPEDRADPSAAGSDQ